MNIDLNILLVEDNPGDARLVKEALNESTTIHASLHIAGTLHQAIEYLTDQKFDVILLDLSLPDGHGLQSATNILKAVPQTPVVILTGLDDETVGYDAIREGAQDYLIKGQFDSKLLVRVIRYSIERKQSALEKEKMINELQELLHEVKTLKGLLPMCAWCKKIRDDKGDWVMLESYIVDHSNADVTHGICPECAAKQHSQVAARR
jgi:CheY-like chemotaxis protein